MYKTTFLIDGVKRIFSIENSPQFKYGDDEILSNAKNDITYGQPWYDNGYTEALFLTPEEFAMLRNGLTNSIGSIIEKECAIDVNGFNLENYHKFVTNNDEHFKIVSKTRDLFSGDFSFDIKLLMPRFEKILGFKLTDIDPHNKNKVHIIVRINRPLSNDYNPPHKDIYEGVDNGGYIPQFANFWIPIAGCNNKSNLPLAPKSHSLSESKILRTFEGGLIQGNKYRVRMIKSWDGNNELYRSGVQYGEVLIFSSHLVHGLALNDNPDITRVALEFRLFRV